ncbi:MAG TPA: YitT family protein [bacterium]|nr:YitT family protein [bacterium]HPS31036.1 YitT family protein [bacterium]
MNKYRAKSDILIDIFFLTVGVICADIGLAAFLLPNGFLDGGVTGISMFLAEMTGLRLSFFLVVVNIPFLAVGWKHLGKSHVLRGVFTIAALAVVLYLIKVPEITDDKLLVACFGGFFLGTGIGLVLRGGGVLDGTELMALIISRKTSVSVGSIILGFNIILFSVVAATLGLERAMYSALTYLVASKSIDLVLHGIEEYAAVIIISPCNPEIKSVLIKEMGIGLTSYLGKTGLSGKEQEILYCVVSRFDLPTVREAVLGIDEKAFLVTHAISDSSGGLIRSRLRRFS